jgi:leucine-rich repeat kinase 2
MAKKSKGEPNISTDGIDIEDWVITVSFSESGKVKKEKVTVSVWDFAGQELYYSSHQFFLSDRSICILSYNIYKR